MNVLSLFDGISCGQVAFNRLGIKYTNYYASEVDKYAIKVTQHNFPNTKQLGDIQNIKGIDLPKIDIIMGGSPCQGFSFSGKQLNFNDPRSRLFFDFERLLKEVNPKYFLLENVKMKKEYQDVISEKLGVQPIEFNSSLVSAQNRKRLYWTNIPVNELIIDKMIYWKDIQLQNAVDVYYLTEKMINWINKDDRRKYRFKVYDTNSQVKMQMLEASHYKGISNQRCFSIMDNGRMRYIHPIECERLQTLPDNYTKIISNTQRYKSLGNGWTVDIICHILRGIKNV
jgi:DNA-cytosine methyltransferase